MPSCLRTALEQALTDAGVLQASKQGRDRAFLCPIESETEEFSSGKLRSFERYPVKRLAETHAAFVRSDRGMRTERHGAGYVHYRKYSKPIRFATALYIIRLSAVCRGSAPLPRCGGCVPGLLSCVRSRRPRFPVRAGRSQQPCRRVPL